MKLYTRLIDAGTFIFWSSDGEDSSYNLKIKAVIGVEKITLVDIYPERGQNFYSFDRVGSGDYEIELNAYKGNKLYQTETKNIKLISSVQKSEENMGSIRDLLSSILEKLDEISIDTSYIRGATNDPELIANIKKSVNRIMQYY